MYRFIVINAIVLVRKYQTVLSFQIDIEAIHRNFLSQAYVRTSPTKCLLQSSV